MRYYIGNWKANKNYSEVKEWCREFKAIYTPQEEVTVGICPPYPFLGYLQAELGSLKNVFIGAQNVSLYEEGSYTGEVSAKSLENTVKFSIIGHSERRKTFGETDQELAEKTTLARKYGIESVYCIRDEKDPIPGGLRFIAYEPVASIGTGQNESLERVLEVKKKMTLPPNCIFIYGGSVNEKNVGQYLISKEISGFLIGKASLNPKTFLQIVR